eukprot:1137102-Pelagomonas_calceolata.AAC.1
MSTDCNFCRAHHCPVVHATAPVTCSLLSSIPLSLSCSHCPCHMLTTVMLPTVPVKAHRCPCHAHRWFCHTDWSFCHRSQRPVSLTSFFAAPTYVPVMLTGAFVTPTGSTVTGASVL